MKVSLEGLSLQSINKSCSIDQVWPLFTSFVAATDIDPLQSEVVWTAPNLFYRGFEYELPLASEWIDLVNQTEDKCYWLEPTTRPSSGYGSQSGLADGPDNKRSKEAVCLRIRKVSVKSLKEAEGQYPFMVYKPEDIPKACLVARRVWETRIDATASFGRSFAPSLMTNILLEAEVLAMKDFETQVEHPVGFSAIHLSVASALPAMGEDPVTPLVEKVTFNPNVSSMRSTKIKHYPSLFSRTNVFMDMDGELRCLDLEDVAAMAK